MVAPPHQEQPVSLYDLDKKIRRTDSSTSISTDDSHCRDNNNKVLDKEVGGPYEDLLAERPSQGSNLSAFFNIVCLVAGTGTLGLPYSLAKGTEIQGLTQAHVNISDKVWIWICCGFVSIPFVLMKTLKEVSLLSIFGVIATAVLVGVTMVESGLDYKNHKDTVEYDGAILRNLPLAVATISVCFGGNVVYMHVE
ncbi:hypothetical protein BGZ58_009695 [Dissophora ornata]|nr:hypothetical protein BGZ58_009695 [Dissophora ornata]